MNEFKAALNAFLAGQVGFDQVDLMLARSLQADPSIGPMAFAAIDQVYRGGRLPLQLYVALKNRIAQSHAAAQERGAQPAQPAQPPPARPAPPQPPTWQAPPPPPARQPAQPPPAWQAPQQPPAPAWQALQAAQPPPPQPTRQLPQPPPPPPAPPASYTPPAARPAPDPAPAAPPRAARETPPIAPAAPPPPSAAAPEGGGDRTIMRGRPPPRPGPEASQPHSVPRGDPSVPEATGGFRHAPTLVGDPTGQTGGRDPTGQTGGRDPTGQTGGPFTSRTGTGSTGTGNSSWTDASKWADQPSQVLERGSVLKGRFVLENVVGRGGMGVVFRAKDLRKEEAQDRDPYVAIKILNDEFRRHPESLKALQRESRKSQTLAHPNIVNVYDFDRDGATVYMTMEFLEGEALDRTIKNPQFEGMSLDEAYPIIEGLGRALSYAHGKGIVHSDFKPGNCFLTKSGVVKVFDFGIAQAAKMQGSAQGEMTKFDAGTLGALTPAYASWEMIEGQQPDQRDDIYALGCVIYELLTGKHPFNKKSAKEARDEKLVPPIVKGLNRLQQRTLRKAIAFQRADRSASVDEILKGLGKQSANPARIAIGVAAVLIVAVVGYFGLLQWQAQQTERLVEALVSGDDNRVPAALEDLNARDVLEKNNILQQVREPLLDWYELRVKRVADVDRQLYGFPAAERILDDEARQWYPDSARIVELRTQLLQSRNDLLDALDGRYNDALKAGRLLPDPNADDVPELLAIVAQVQPNHKLLADSNLAVARALAYEERATAELGRKNLGPAADLIEVGLERFPDHAGLRNLRDRLTVERSAEENAQRVAALRDRLATVPRLRTLTELRDLKQPVAELAALSPNDDLLGTYRQRLGPALDAEVQAAVNNRDWDGAQRLVDDVAELLTADYQTSVRNRVTAARADYDRRVETLMAGLSRAATEGRMDAARKALDDLRGMSADETTIRQGTTSIIGGYAQAAQQFLTEGKFDDAKISLDAGLVLEPTSTRLLEMSETLTQRRTAAVRADQEADERDRVAQANTLRTSLAAALNQPSLSIDAAERVVADADKLALVAADDPLAGRRSYDKLATIFADQAMTMGGQDKWDDALKLLDRARGVVGESPAIDAARVDIVADREADRARQGEERVAQQQQSLDALLNAPRYDAAWVTEVRNTITAIRRAVPENDPRLAALTASQQRAGQLLVARAGEMREAKRFDEAERMLTAARDFAAGLPALATEQQALAAARESAQRATELERATARVAGLKSTFETRVTANNVAGATAALDELRKELPATDAYLTTTAPQQLAGVYARLADGPLKDKDFDRAQRFVDEGLKLSPRSTELQKLSTDIRDARAAAARAPQPSPAAPAPTPPPTTTTAPAVVPAVVTTTPPPAAAGSGAPVKGTACTDGIAGFGSRGARAQCFDQLDASVRGPMLVVVPAGAGLPAFAISRTEVSVGQWADYCKLSASCTALPDEATFPATNLDAVAIEGYATWLTQRTGVAYRLPTSAEWLYAASGPRTEQLNFNCVSPVRGSGGRVQVVGQDNGNTWGLRDYFGNVRELVKTAGGYEVRGGDYRDQMQRCNADRVDAHSGAGDAFTGFRLVRALGEQR